MFPYDPVIHKLPEKIKETLLELRLEIEPIPLVKKEEDDHNKIIQIEIL
jgi:hypothetical protein